MNAILLWLHFIGLAVAFAGGMGSAQVGPRFAAAAEAERPLLGSLMRTFGIMTAVGFAVLIVTGPLLVWLKFGGFQSMPTPWFHVKMALVALIVIAIGGQQMSARSFRQGNAAALGRLALFGRATGILAILTVLAAVLAFD